MTLSSMIWCICFLSRLLPRTAVLTLPSRSSIPITAVLAASIPMLCIRCLRDLCMFRALPPMKSFVDLYLAVRPTAELSATSALVLQSKANAMQHEPSRLLSYSDSSGDLVGTNSIAAIGNHPDHYQPLLQSDRR